MVVSYKLQYGTLYPKKYAHGFCFAVLCYGYTLTDFPISIRLTSLALWQSNDCPSASKATLMNMGKYFMWIHYERLHNHNKAKHNKTVCIFLGIYCNCMSVDNVIMSQRFSLRDDYPITPLPIGVYSCLMVIWTTNTYLPREKCNHRYFIRVFFFSRCSNTYIQYRCLAKIPKDARMWQWMIKRRHVMCIDYLW